ncbi:MAG: TetR/AcrR family transcriptional regulator [Acidimicrobiia bacterium]
MVESSEIRGRGRPKTFDRDRVIDVAMDCYWREGTDGVSLNDLCRRATVSKPGVYREFGGEDGLMDAVLERYAETVLAPTWELTTRDGPFEEILDALVGFMTDPDRGMPPGCLLSKMRVLSSRLGPSTQSRVDTLREDARATYARWVERAKKRGEITSNAPTTVIAAFIDTQFTTLLTQMALGEDPELLRAQAALAFAGLTVGFDDHSRRA